MLYFAVDLPAMISQMTFNGKQGAVDRIVHLK